MSGESSTSNVVRLNVLSSALGGALGNSKNFNLDMTIGDLKKKLVMIIGTEEKYQQLQLRTHENDKSDNLVVVCEMQDDSATLGSYQPADGMSLFVVDTDPNQQIQSLQNTEGVEKYKISDEDYNKRKDTYKNYIEEKIKIGVNVTLDNDKPLEGRRKGVVAYVGNADFAPGMWVGVVLESAQGKNDGSVKGKRYFDAKPKYGCFARVKDVLVAGDVEKETVTTKASTTSTTATDDADDSDEI